MRPCTTAAPTSGTSTTTTRSFACGIRAGASSRWTRWERSSGRREQVLVTCDKGRRSPIVAEHATRADNLSRRSHMGMEPPAPPTPEADGSCSDRERSPAVTASFPSLPEPERWRLRMLWLPPFGRGNGLDASSWAPLADIAPELVGGLLEA